jgi:hypothetical protein
MEFSAARTWWRATGSSCSSWSARSSAGSRQPPGWLSWAVAKKTWWGIRETLGPTKSPKVTANPVLTHPRFSTSTPPAPCGAHTPRGFEPCRRHWPRSPTRCRRLRGESVVGSERGWRWMVGTTRVWGSYLPGMPWPWGCALKRRGESKGTGIEARWRTYYHHNVPRHLPDLRLDAWWMTSPLGTPRGRCDEYSS